MCRFLLLFHVVQIVLGCSGLFWVVLGCYGLFKLRKVVQVAFYGELSECGWCM